jgi:hypothetical protein
MAKDGEVAHSFQPLMEVSRSFFWGAHGGQVADPMIEARFSNQFNGSFVRRYTGEKVR